MNSSNPICSRITERVANLTKWGNNRFGDIPSRIGEAQKKLEMFNAKASEEDVAKQIKKVESVLDDLLESEELWWAQRLEFNG